MFDQQQEPAWIFPVTANKHSNVRANKLLQYQDILSSDNTSQDVHESWKNVAHVHEISNNTMHTETHNRRGEI